MNTSSQIPGTACGHPSSRQPAHPFIWAVLFAALLAFLLAPVVARADISPPGCTGSGLGILLFTAEPDVHIGDTIHYSVTVFNGTGTGPVVCDASSITAYLVTPDGISHQITLVRTNLFNGQSDYYPSVLGTNAYVVRAQDIQSDGTVRATATDSGIIHQNITDSEGGGNQGVNTIVSLPCISLAAQCTGSVGETGAITFSGTVTNCGNDTLVDVTVTNFVNGGAYPVTFITNILSGQVASFSGSYVPLNPCSPSTITLVASGTDQYTTAPRTVTSSITNTCSDTLTAGILVTKTCPAQAVAPGQLLTFSGTVSNTGNVTLTGIVVVNNQPSANTTVFAAASLAPGAITNFTGSYLAPTNCSVTDTLIATATSACGIPVTNSASATCALITTPAISVSLNCPANPTLAGTLLTFTGTVGNTGNIPLTNVVVLNNLSGNTPVFTAALLQPGATASFSGSYIAPINCASISTATASGRSVCGVAVTNTATATCAVITSPALNITQNCPATPVAPGALLTYTGTVTNAGNITLTNVMVLNSLSGTTPVFTAATLAAGAGASFTGSYLAPTACSVVSISTVTGTSICGTTVTNSVASTCAITTTPVLALTQTCPASPTAPGAVFTYTGTVTNTGNITVTNVVILNNLSGSTPVFTAATLAPGAGTSFTGSYLTPTNCSTTSTSVATGRSVCGVVATASVSSTCAILTTPALAMTQNCPALPPAPGALMTYTGTITNTGDITLTNVVVLNNLSGTTPVIKVASLAPGMGASFSGSYLTPTNCSVTSTSTGSAESVCGAAITNTVSATCAIATTPALKITQACPAGPTVPGAVLTFSGTVTNTGNITLTNVVVLNDQSGTTPIFTAVSLAPGVGASYTGSYLAPTNCSVTSTSTATGQSLCGVGITNAVSSTCAISTTPLLVITQLCPQTPVAPGGLFTYSGSVSNAGNITLTNVVILNNLSGSTPLLTLLTLAPSATAAFTGSYLAPTNCSTTSTSTVTGKSICGNGATNAVTTTCAITTTPVLNVTENCPAIQTVPGAVLTYTGTVTNAGNITLTNVVVLNNLSGATPVFTVATLAPGAGARYTGSYLTPTNCSVTSVSTASGQSTCGVTVTNSVSATCAITTTPALKVTQACPATVVAPGGLLTYSGTITNMGNIPLTNVVVLNNLSGTTPVFTAATLAPGVGASFTGSYLAPTNCSTTSTSTATGTSICGVAVTNSATSTCSLTTTPAIIITQACPLNPAIPGGLLTYSGSVSNAGNILLTNVVVLNNMSGTTPVFIALALAPGVVTNFTGSYLAPTNCSVTSISTATGRSICGIAVTNAITSTCSILTTPAIYVVHTCPATPVLPGGILTYSGSVSNAGNITLTNIIVVSDRPVAGTTVFTVASLAPGATAGFTGSYVTPLNCCVVWSTLTASGLGCAGVTVTDEDTSTCTISTEPALVVTKVCTPGILVPGDLLTYSGSVSNSGNITLIDVTVTDSEAPGNPPITGTIDLAPGQSVAFYGSYLVQPDFCGTDTLTASGLDVCNYLPVDATVTTTCPITTTPRITVVENCPLLPTPRGGLFTYTGSVSNAGNVSLVNVYVVNDEPSNNTPVVGPITLAPGMAVNFTNSYVAPTCCCLIIDTLTARGQDHCTASNVTASATSVCPLLTLPGIAVVENCPSTPIPMGSLFLFTGYVTNTGDVDLTNVFVYGPLGTNAAVLGPIQLAPGQAATYFGTFTAVFNTRAVTVSATGQEICGGTFATNSAGCPVVTTPALNGGNGTNRISFPTALGETYTLQYKNNLLDPAWTNLSAVTGNGHNQTITDPIVIGQPSRFYRIMVSP